MPDSGNENIEAAIKTFENFKSVLKEPNILVYVTLTIVGVILFSLFFWIYSTLQLKQQACKNLEILYKNENRNINPIFSGPNTQSPGSGLISSSLPAEYSSNLSGILRNFYVKSAFNCCCGDGYKNNFVNICALERAITEGYRFLDFEIYSFGDEPIIAASTANNNSIKETYNALKFKEVLKILNEKVFNTANGQGGVTDPCFLHFRIMSENTNIFDKMADYIESEINSEFLIQNSSSSEIIISKLSSCYNKFIFIFNAHPSNNIFNGTKLEKYINLKSGTSDVKLYRFTSIFSFGKDSAILQNQARPGLVIVIPDNDNKEYNYDAIYGLLNGCQFNCMKLQFYDNNLMAYDNFFKDNHNLSFVLKNPSIRKDLIPTHEAQEAPAVSNIEASGLLQGTTGST